MPAGLGSFLLFVMQNLTGSAAPSPPPASGSGIITSGTDYSTEIRVKFPGPTDPNMPPSSLDGSIWTFSNGTPSSINYISLWYEKPTATSATGNLYLTSSAGRLQITSASIFDGNLYNLVVVREHQTGSMSLYAVGYVDGIQTYAASASAFFGKTGAPVEVSLSYLELGPSIVSASFPQFWGQEFRQWSAPLIYEEVLAHTADFESFGRDVSWNNKDLQFHWRLNDGVQANGAGQVFFTDSTLNDVIGTGSFPANAYPYNRFLLDHAYLPGIEYGWNQDKVRQFSGSFVDPFQAYHDERYVSLELNMYDALNEDISHLMTSYQELETLLGLPVNRYRETYEGLQQMRETYFKRLQGQLNFRVFQDMLEFFDRTFVSLVPRLLPARAIFQGEELVVESHMLERPKYQYGLRPFQQSMLDISGSIPMTDSYYDEFDS